MKPGIAFTGWSCPLALQNYTHIVMAHGGGGRLSADLVAHLILPALGGRDVEALGDSTVVPPIRGRLALTTDSYVVKPIFFPGGSIGELAVNGTVNDLAMAGARPLYLTAGLILEKGLPLATLAEVVGRMGEAARLAGVRIVAGDTKVVGKGQADGVFINTAGVGEMREEVQLNPAGAKPGDVVLISGTIGDHGMTILSVREQLEFFGLLESDCAALHGLTEVRFSAAGGSDAVHVMRDPTRGGLAASLNEIALSSRVGIEIQESLVPIAVPVRAACEILGFDPLHVANEGRLVAIVAAKLAGALLDLMRHHPLGSGGRRIDPKLPIRCQHRDPAPVSGHRGMSYHPRRRQRHRGLRPPQRMPIDPQPPRVWSSQRKHILPVRIKRYPLILKPPPRQILHRSTPHRSQTQPRPSARPRQQRMTAVRR